MVIDVRSRTAERVGPRLAPPLGQGRRQTAGRLCVFGAINDFQELQEIALDLDTAVAERVAKVQIHVGQKLPKRVAVVDFHVGFGSGMADGFTVPKHQRDRRVANGAQQAANQPALHGPHPAAFPAGSRWTGLRHGLPDHCGGRTDREETDEPIRGTSRSILSRETAIRIEVMSYPLYYFGQPLQFPRSFYVLE